MPSQVIPGNPKPGPPETSTGLDKFRSAGPVSSNSCKACHRRKTKKSSPTQVFAASKQEGKCRVSESRPTNKMCIKCVLCCCRKFLTPQKKELSFTQRIHGTGICTYIYHKNQPNLGKYTIFPWILWVMSPFLSLTRKIVFFGGDSCHPFLQRLGCVGFHPTKTWHISWDLAGILRLSWLVVAFHGNPKPSFLGVITHILGV